MERLISQQAAIDALRDYLIDKRCPDDGTLTCRLIENEVINKLPSVQPEPSWDCEKCMMEHTDEMEKLEAELAIAKSKQPEPCEDAVSRKAVKDGFAEMCSLICPYTEKQRHAMCGSCLLGTAFDVLEATQSVTPKQRTGYWIPVGMVEAVGGESAQWGSAIAYHKCSECDGQALMDDFEQEVLSEWCPHCGAKMEVTT